MDKRLQQLDNIFSVIGGYYIPIARNNYLEIPITGASQENPVFISASGDSLQNNDEVYIANVGGMTEINDRTFLIDDVTPSGFTLIDEDGTSHTAYTSGGTAIVGRLQYATISQIVGNRVAKSGDTMTGKLIIHNSALLVRTLGGNNVLISGGYIDIPDNRYIRSNIPAGNLVNILGLDSANTLHVGSTQIGSIAFDLNGIEGFFSWDEDGQHSSAQIECGNIVPASNNNFNIATSTNIFKNIHAESLHLYSPNIPFGFVQKNEIRTSWDTDTLWSISPYQSGNVVNSGLLSYDFEQIRWVFNNQPYVDANKIWHAGNDGSESGLDADTVDGSHASAFSTASHDHDSDYVSIADFESAVSALCQGRLTLSSTEAFTTIDQTAKTTLYFLPYKGNKIGVYTGSSWELFTLSSGGVSIDTTGLSASTVYDVFIYSDNGTLTLALTAWTNSTTRASAISLQDGIYVKTSDPGQRYLGTVYVNASTQFTDSSSARFVWNYYNQAERPFLKFEHSATASWSYTTNTWRAANGSSNNKIEFVCGLASTIVDALLSAGNLATSTPANAFGLDSITTPFANHTYSFGSNAGAQAASPNRYKAAPGIGYHYLAWLEWGNTGATFFGTSASSLQKSGITGHIMG